MFCLTIAPPFMTKGMSSSKRIFAIGSSFTAQGRIVAGFERSYPGVPDVLRRKNRRGWMACIEGAVANHVGELARSAHEDRHPRPTEDHFHTRRDGLVEALALGRSGVEVLFQELRRPALFASFRIDVVTIINIHT